MGEVGTRLHTLLFEKAQEISVSIHTIEIMPDHVHLFIKTIPTNAPHFIVQQLKGYSARYLRQEFPLLQRLPSMWTRSYYCESVGHISEQSVIQYIESQKNK